jgi:hypothetical protein
MPGSQGYSITTKCLRLCCGHPGWLRQTQEYYNEIAEFYYNLLLERPELWDKNSQQTLRELECLSLPGREKRTPEHPLPWPKIPLYFRRAAANTGIAAAKSHISRMETAPGRKAEKLNAAVTYYKGMYRDFTPSEITLKVWDGTSWQWMRCRLYGRSLPKQVQFLSPCVVLGGKFDMLHIPVKEPSGDTATVKQRMEEGRNICSLQFTNGDAFAAGCVLDQNGREQAVRFWKGGKEYAHRCRQLIKKIEKSRNSLGDIQQEHPNQKYWIHLKHLSEHYAHQISAEIIKFSLENHASVIVLPKYSEAYTRNVLVGSGNWSPLHLSLKIREYLRYKAWKAGIIVIEVHAEGIHAACAICGSSITATDRTTDEYTCEQGHRGSRSLNSARNLGRKCLRQFGKQVVL